MSGGRLLTLNCASPPSKSDIGSAVCLEGSSLGRCPAVKFTPAPAPHPTSRLALQARLAAASGAGGGSGEAFEAAQRAAVDAHKALLTHLRGEALLAAGGPLEAPHAAGAAGGAAVDAEQHAGDVGGAEGAARGRVLELLGELADHYIAERRFEQVGALNAST